MYRVSDELLNAIKNNTARALISFDLVSGSVSDITNDEIAALSIERASVSGRSLEIGAARAFEMTLRLNTIGKYGVENFKGVRFEGAEARVRIGYATSRGVEYIPLGVFTVDGCEKQDGEIELAALDRMVKFDRDADFSSIVFPISVESLALRACYACGIDTSRLNLSDLPNASYLVEQAPGACTWRRVLMWCLEIMGVCAYIDAEGYIVAKWYEDTGEKLTTSDRFDHKIHENDVVVRGVQIIDEEEMAHLAGEASGFVFTIEGNELLTHDHDAVASSLAAVLVGFRHRPFEAEALPHPHLFPLDMLTYIDEDGEEIAVCVSGCVFTMNDNTELTGAGESETTSGYASLDPMTERERAIVAAALKKQEAAIIEKTGGIFEQKAEALTRMNEVVANALGLYVITYTEADGSTQTYFCNKPTLAESSLIYVFNAGGFAWTDAWGGSNAATVWRYGITKDGNAVLNYLSINRLTADYIDATDLTVSSANIKGKLTASQIDATNLKVEAANITGALTIGQLPSTVAETSDLPTKVSDLTNDSGFQTRSGVVSIVDGRITADFIEALNISVSAAQITGKLTASQIDADGITAAELAATYYVSNGTKTNYFNGSGVSQRYKIGSTQTYESVFDSMQILFRSTVAGSTTTSYGDASGFKAQSDKNAKKDIEELQNEYGALFDLLKPVRFKYKGIEGSGFYTGFIAQEVEEAVRTVGLSESDFSSLVKRDGSYWLDYNGFVALCVGEIQRLKKRVKELENGGQR